MLQWSMHKHAVLRFKTIYFQGGLVTHKKQQDVSGGKFQGLRA